jgi:glycosyltransferase involved in cell wall biosynthesis
MTRASVLIPTHDKHTTIGLAVDSVLRQSVEDLEVLIVGDGVTDALRATIERLVAADPRVRFLDFPKGPHHGERYRHDAILAAESDAIFYQCDDDLFLPEHVADLLALLEDHNFVQCLNGYCRPDGSVAFFAADLSNPTTLHLMLDERLGYNNASITGTAHSRAFYLEVGDRWDTTPTGLYADHHQWRKLWRHPSYRGATSHRMTTVQLPTSSDGRDTWTPEQRQEELERWYALVTAPDAQEQYDAIVATSARRALAELRDDGAWLRGRLADAEARVAELESLLEDADRRLARVRTRLARKNATIARLRARRSPSSDPQWSPDGS